MNFRKRYQNKVMAKKREVADRIKKEFIESGDADEMIKIIRKKREPSVKPNQLPF